MLIQTRAQLAAMVHATYRDNLTKGEKSSPDLTAKEF